MHSAPKFFQLGKGEQEHVDEDPHRRTRSRLHREPCLVISYAEAKRSKNFVKRSMAGLLLRDILHVCFPLCS